jgi:hypothetical protein
MKMAWRFFRAGGFDQVRIESGDELSDIGKLDRKLWVALSCPIEGVEFDSDTLALIDSDGDGHIRDKELVEAVEWAASCLSDKKWLASGEDSLPLSAISSEEILAAARHMLKTLGKPDEEKISLSDCADMKEIPVLFNGDGIVPIDAAESESERRIMAEMLEAFGKEDSGITQDMIDAFYDDINAYAAWLEKGMHESAIMPLGEKTGEAFSSWQAVRAKAEDYFRRCRIVAYDPDQASAINPSEAVFSNLSSLDLSSADLEIAALPLSKAEIGKAMPLVDGLNPLWIDALRAFHDSAVLPLLGRKKSVTEEDWKKLCMKLQPYLDWQAEKPESAVAKLGDGRILEIAAGGEKELLAKLIERDLALEPEAKAMAKVEKLLRYSRDLSSFANNFVSFRDFYTGRDNAIFQAGTLYMDGRSCELCVYVKDMAKHAMLASMSRICLAYCECRRGAEKMIIAAAFTAGDSDQLMIGRNGVFYDRKDRDWDATIVRIIDHPISIRQAFMSPYKTMGKMVGEQIQKIAASRSHAIQASAAKAISESEKTAAKPFDVGKFAGIFAAIGLAVGAIGGAIASIVTGLLGLKFWQLPFALFFLAMAVSGPSMLIAWFKLRQRNLGPILDANGWAINTRAKINIPFGTSLTQLAKLPEGAERSLVDPYAEKKRSWIGYFVFALLLLLALLWRFFR